MLSVVAGAPAVNVTVERCPCSCCTDPIPPDESPQETEAVRLRHYLRSDASLPRLRAAILRGDPVRAAHEGRWWLAAATAVGNSWAAGLAQAYIARAELPGQCRPSDAERAALADEDARHHGGAAAVAAMARIGARTDPFTMAAIAAQAPATVRARMARVPRATLTAGACPRPVARPVARCRARRLGQRRTRARPPARAPADPDPEPPSPADSWPTLASGVRP
jgi:hypothetical protein